MKLVVTQLQAPGESRMDVHQNARLRYQIVIVRLRVIRHD